MRQGQGHSAARPRKPREVGVQPIWVRLAADRGRPVLDHRRIVAAAIAIADHDGLAELSMRHIASRLGVSTMALYRHVPGKDELTLAMIDAAIGEVRLPPRPPASRRAALELVSRLEWRVFQRHPWLASTMSLTRPQLAPNAMLITEWVMGVFDGTRLTMQERLYIQILLFSFVRGVASALEPEAEAVQETGLTNEQWMDAQTATFLAHMAAGEMPHFRELAGQEFDFDLTTLFEFGLGRLLDGLVPYIERRSS
jgi:AcrR family transcriptional regulator